MIDIIVDCSNKTVNQIKETLGSICYQLEMPEVYVHINEKIPEKILNHYKKFIRINDNMENIDGNSIMYINGGDSLASPYSLKKLYTYSQYDVVVSDCLRRDKSGIQYNMFDDTENFYGKLYKRNFLDNKKINYSNKFILNKLCMMSTPMIYFLDYKTYLVKETKQNTEEYINNIIETLKIGSKLKLYNGIYQLATEILIDMYHKYLNNKLEIDIRSLRYLVIIHNKYKNDYEIFVKLSKYQFTLKDVIPEISFYEFLKKVMSR